MLGEAQNGFLEGPKSVPGAPKSTLGDPRVPQSAQERPKSDPKATPERPKSVPRAPKNDPRAPKGAQARPKSVPRAPKSGPRASKRHPGGLWGRSDDALGSILERAEAENISIFVDSTAFFSHFSVSRRPDIDPKSAPNRPKSAQDRSKSLVGAPFELLRATKANREGQSSAQERLKRAQGRPRTTQDLGASRGRKRRNLDFCRLYRVFLTFFGSP